MATLADAPGVVEIAGPADLREVMRSPHTLSDQQWAAVSAPLEPTVVIAGAGSGKTSLMAARVVYLVATGQVRPEEVLGLTFTTKAAAELRQRVRSALEAAGLSGADDSGRARASDGDEDPVEVQQPVVSTYHAYAGSLLTEHGLRIGHEPDTRLLADASRYQLAARVVAAHRGPVHRLSDHPPTVVGYLLALDGSLGEHLVDPARLRTYDQAERVRFLEARAADPSTAQSHPSARAVEALDKRAELLDLVEGYRRLKRELGVMDFSDQIALAARLAAEHPEVGVAERAAHRVVLLDEYQDTSVAQARMLAALFSGGHPVTAVGDPHQAIYGWRGASVGNILGFGHDFPRADGSTDVPRLPLTVNRRSDTRILEVANALAAPLQSDTAGVAPLDPEPGRPPGTVEVAAHETYLDELEWLAGEVEAAHERVGSWREIGVLVRDNQHAADTFDRLSKAGLPVEIVGLQGLLALPEVAEVLATLTLISDLTANAELLTLLTGPRWAIGPRDLSLLGRRAAELAGRSGRIEERLPLAEALQHAVTGADPTDVVALSDALADPGEPDQHPYSELARVRFAMLDRELRVLRSHVGEPLLDLVRRVVDTTGIDVELASSLSPAARARRENLDLFVKAVAEFRAVDGEVSLSALLAWFAAEDEQGQGLDVATPSEADSVKLLTVHRSKGLEWDEVFCLGVVTERFPVSRARSLWTTSPSVLPHALRGDARDLAVLRGHGKADLDRLRAEAKEHDQAEERRLGYVAFTRARHRLWVSSYHWRHGRLKPNGPSPYQLLVKELVDSWRTGDAGPAAPWTDAPRHEANPLVGEGTAAAWPVTEVTAEAQRRLAAAERVRRAAREEQVAEDLDLYDAATVLEWDEAIEVLLDEAGDEATTEVRVPLPPSLSATTVARVRDEPEQLARDLARPMPRRPSPQARFGTRFHAWVEARFGQQELWDPEELPGRADAGIDDEEDFATLTARFEEGPFGDREPLAVEPSFALVLGGQVVRGRIDAVYAEPDGSFLVVDWKTHRTQSADPLQLAVYRLAWAELHGVPLEQVRVAFHYVRTGQTVTPPDSALPDRAGLERLLSP